MDPGGRTGWNHAANYGNRGLTWDGVLVSCFGLEWNLKARCPHTWACSFDEFVEKAYKYAKSSKPASPARAKSHKPTIKKPRLLADLLLPWGEHEVVPIAEIVGDNELVISWCNGKARCVDLKRAEKIV